MFVSINGHRERHSLLNGPKQRENTPQLPSTAGSTGPSDTRSRARRRRWSRKQKRLLEKERFQKDIEYLILVLCFLVAHLHKKVLFRFNTA